MNKKEVILREEHKFAKYEVLALIGFFILGLAYTLSDALFINPGRESMLSVIITGLIVFALGWLFVLLLRNKLSFEVNRKNIKISYFPIFKKKRKIKWKEVKEVKEFNIPLESEWSGWMVSFGGLRDYCVSRHKGVLMTLHNGEQIFLETDNPEVFQDIHENKG
ncbi:MAG: hypothetical protein R2769_08940 [Saprospiraceae bacterium]